MAANDGEPSVEFLRRAALRSSSFLRRSSRTLFWLLIESIEAAERALESPGVAGCSGGVGRLALGRSLSAELCRAEFCRRSATGGAGGLGSTSGDVPERSDEGRLGRSLEAPVRSARISSRSRSAPVIGTVGVIGDSALPVSLASRAALRSSSCRRRSSRPSRCDLMLSAAEERELDGGVGNSPRLSRELSRPAALAARAALRLSSAARRSSMWLLPLPRSLELPSGRSLVADDMSALLSRDSLPGGVGRIGDEGGIGGVGRLAAGVAADESGAVVRRDDGRSLEASVRSARSSARSLSAPVACSTAVLTAPATVFSARSAWRSARWRRRSSKAAFCASISRCVFERVSDADGADGRLGRSLSAAE